MNGVDPEAFRFALSQIDDGFVFEEFAKDFLSKILSYEFVPAGGVKDRGIDGLEHLFERKGYERYIYQASKEKTCEAKLEKTLQKLKENKIKFEALYYVTNRDFPNKDKVIDSLFEQYHKPIHIWDIGWLSSHVNDTNSTVNTYQIFVSSYLHEFAKPGKSYVVDNLIDDPRLFVFLRQQWETNRKDLELDVILADTLILYCLEGTDPDKKIFRTKEQIKEDIARHIKFDPKALYPTVDRRLKELADKPRRIKYHSKGGGYCLPYETRVQISERNLKDGSLYDKFRTQIEEKLKTYLRNADVRVRDCTALIESAINRLFYQQGLEFADFILHGQSQAAVEKQLPDIIGSVVDESPVVLRNKEEVKTSLLMTIRDIVYDGTEEQRLFLERLSNTYLMLFLLQCDPKLATFFHTMASKLDIYVCTSIIIPAISEYFLEERNRRYWNLLKEARDSGINLLINDIILKELVSHFRMILNKYENEYKDTEHLYVSDEGMTFFIDDILLRAYFYAKRRKKTQSFYDFIDTFLNPNLANAESDLIEWLKEEFGIEYKSNESIGIKLRVWDVNPLYDALKAEKSHPEKARNDTKLILTIYAIREKNNETSGAGIFGFRTWCLSIDTVTQRTINKVFQNRYETACYIRPDFLYNYITLAPKKGEVDAAYRALFPSLVGVNISFHLPKEVTDFIHQCVTEHKTKNPSRLRAILRDLAEKLKTDAGCRTRQYVKHFLDEKLKHLVPTEE
jgi:hypothetical protein